MAIPLRFYTLDLCGQYSTVRRYTLKGERRMVEMSTQKARAGFSEVVSRAGYGGERIILTRRGRAVAAIVPVKDLERLDGSTAQAVPEERL